jgi:DNA-binding MarR family transcriptional regulator
MNEQEEYPMNEVKRLILEQLQQLQSLMHRTLFRGYWGGGRSSNPYRGQGRVLAILKMKPEISQKELTYLLNMSKQSLAELLAKLERSGYIVREPSQEDKRVMNIKLTDSGRKAAEEMDDDSEPELYGLFDCLNDDELCTLSDYLGRMIKQYEELYPEDHFEERRHMMEDFVMQYGREFTERSGFGGNAESRHEWRDGFFRGGHGHSR